MSKYVVPRTNPSKYTVPRTNPSAYVVPRTNPIVLRPGERRRLPAESVTEEVVEVAEEESVISVLESFLSLFG